MTRSQFCDRTAVVVAIAMCGGLLQAKQKNRSSDPDPRQDEIVVEAHLAGIQGPITRFVAAQRYADAGANRSHGESQLAIHNNSERGDGSP